MKYPPRDGLFSNLLTVCTYGSHLYGTNSETSDHDFKAVYLPDLVDLLLAKAPRVLRFRFDAEGKTLSDSASMPANGYEAEHTPVQKFVHDFLGGQAYAVETAFAVVQGAHYLHRPEPHRITEGRQFAEFEFLCHRLTKQYVHRNVNGMVGFAVKQTFDYVRRGERLNAAKQVLDVLQHALKFYEQTHDTRFEKFDANKIRLDTVSHYIHPVSHFVEAQTLLDHVARETGLPLGETTNQNKKLRTLKLNGREYLETTTLPHLIGAVEKLCDQYGERSTRASEVDVDWKSLSHAVRVYQQVIELLETGFITFPRKNAKFLLDVKKGHHNIEDIKRLLGSLDDKVNALLETSKLPEVDDAFRAKVENEVLLPFLIKLYEGQL